MELVASLSIPSRDSPAKASFRSGEHRPTTAQECGEILDLAKALPKFLTSDDLRAFFGACADREHRVFATILLTGMRRGEIEHLTWPDINFDLGVILIQVKTDKWGGNRRRMNASFRSQARSNSFCSKNTPTAAATRGYLPIARVTARPTCWRS